MNDSHYFENILKEEVSKILLPIPNYGRGIYQDFINTDDECIDEGIYKTFPPQTTVQYVKKLFWLRDDMIRIVSDNGSLPEEKRIQVIYYNDYGNDESMQRAMRLCGYTSSKRLKRDGKYIEEIFIPINLPNLDDIIRKYDFIIHVSPQYFKQKILKNGFVPKSINTMFSYTDRVFFFKGDTPFKEIIYQIMDFDNNNKKKYNNHIYTIYKIDTKKIPSNVHFHTDLTYPFGIYTTENVSPICIETYKDFNIEEFNKQFN